MTHQTSSRPASRGQTVIGFVIAISLFVIVVATYFAFIGGAIDSPVTSEVETNDEAARTSYALINNHLAESSVETGSTAATYRLSHDAVSAFITTGTPQPDTLARGSATQVNVTFRTFDPRGPPTAFNGNTRVNVGPTPPSESLASSDRTTATLDGRTIVITVRTW